VSQGHDPTGTRVMILFNEQWTHLADLSDLIYGMARRRPSETDKGSVALLGCEGLYNEYPSGSSTAREIPINSVEVAYLEDLLALDDCMVACGAQGQVYRLRGKKWQPIHKGLHQTFDGEEVVRQLSSIAGRAADDLYVCSYEGEVFRYDGKTWRELAPPVKAPLNAALAAPDGRIYFCGESGTLLSLEPGNRWRVLSDLEVAKGELHDLALFEDKLHVAAGDALLRLDSDGLHHLDAPPNDNAEVLTLDAGPDRIWCVGGEDVLDWDGARWTRHVCPEN
jgi:hypothetical protein